LKTSLNNKEALKRVTLSNNLLNKVKELEGAFKLDKSTPKELKKIANLLLKQHTPQITDILKQFQINKSDILTGVHCPQCYFISMKRISGAWYCPKCRISSKDAHLFSLNDFALLIDTSITNKKIREFLHLSSRSTASKLLTAMDLEQFGNKRGRVYHLSVL
jgi:ribosomal protein L37AE/L43A